MLDDRIYKRLGVVWFRYRVKQRSTFGDAEERDATRVAVFKEFLTEAQVERLDAYAYPFLKASDSTFLKALIVQRAGAVKNRRYDRKDWRQAVRDMAESARDPTGLWGFQFERRMAVRAASLVVLALGLSFLYRVRRLNPGVDLGKQPWVVLVPWGLREGVGAVLWAGFTILAVAAVMWAIWVYEADVPEVPPVVEGAIADGETIGLWTRLWLVMSYAFVWGTVCAGLAGLFLTRGWLRVLVVIKEMRDCRKKRIKREQAIKGQEKGTSGQAEPDP